MARVAKLLETWSKLMGLSGDDVERWTALGYLHDMLRDEQPSRLRQAFDGETSAREELGWTVFDPLDLPGPALHGPAAAWRLHEEGVKDGPLLTAVAFHTLGNPRLDEMGMALYAADFLEPGRKGRPRWREEARRRLPQDLELVVKEILRLRIRYLLDRGRPVRPETVGFWNVVAKGKAWATASEV